MHTRTPSCWCQVRHSRRRAASVVLLLRELRRHCRCAQYSTVVYSTVQYANCGGTASARAAAVQFRHSGHSARGGRAPMRARMQAHLHTQTYARTRTRTHARAHTHAHASLHAHRRAPAHARSHKRICTRQTGPCSSAGMPQPPRRQLPPPRRPRRRRRRLRRPRLRRHRRRHRRLAAARARHPSRLTRAFARSRTPRTARVLRVRCVLAGGLPKSSPRVSTQSALRAAFHALRRAPLRCTHGASPLHVDMHRCGGRRSVHG